MKKEYESIVNAVCNTPDWGNATEDERYGCIGVACVLSFIKGTKPSIREMSRHLGLYPDEIDIPLKRLSINGVFSTRFDIAKDNVLHGNIDDNVINTGRSEIVFSAADKTRNAWCTIAGIASGFIGLT